MRTALEVLVWWAVCTGVWLLGVAAVTPADVLLGLAAGLLCALLAAFARRLVPVRWAPRAAWLGWAWRVPLLVVLETGSVLAAALRRRPGHEERLPLPRESAARRDTRSALAVLAVSATPGSVVIDADPAEHALRVHVLGRPAPRWARIDPGDG